MVVQCFEAVASPQEDRTAVSLGRERSGSMAVQQRSGVHMAMLHAEPVLVGEGQTQRVTAHTGSVPLLEEVFVMVVAEVELAWVMVPEVGRAVALILSGMWCRRSVIGRYSRKGSHD